MKIIIKLNYKITKKKKDIINELKVDLWGEILLLNSLKFKKLYNNLYFKKKKKIKNLNASKLNFLNNYIYLKNNNCPSTRWKERWKQNT